MPSFSSTRSLMREMVSSDSISISISLPVSVFTLICRADDDRTSARVKKNHRKMQNVCMHAARTQAAPKAPSQGRAASAASTRRARSSNGRIRTKIVPHPRVARGMVCLCVLRREPVCLCARERDSALAARQHHCSRCALHTEHVGPDELPAPRAYARPAREERCACAYVHGCLLSCCADFLMPWLARLGRPKTSRPTGLGFVCGGGGYRTTATPILARSLIAMGA